MRLRNKIAAVGAVAALGVGLGLAAVPSWSADNGHGMGAMGPRMNMGSGMMGPGMMGMGGGDATAAELGAIHELIANHDRITRTVTNLPDGIRTVTESDDPKIAQTIKDHVAQMVERVDARRDPNLPIESDALHTIMRNGDKVKTTVETTEKGSIVTQTSSDAATVAVLQKHAVEVSDVVENGMEAIHTAMMSRGGMMGRGMMQGGTGRGTAPRDR